MKLFARALAIILVVFCPAISKARSIKGSSVKVGAWTVDAYANDATGAFSHCAAGVPYRSGILLVFTIQSGASSWQMGLVNRDWKLPTGERYPISYKIDRGAPLTDMATVLAPGLIAFDLPANSVLFRLFRAGHLLEVSAAGGNFFFDLKGSARALDVALSCTKHYENNPPQVAANPNPFAGSTGSISPAPSDLKTEAATVLANILGAAGIQGFRLVSDIPDSLKEYGYHVIWGAPGMIGGLKVFRDLTVLDAATIVIAQQERECKGTFGSYRERSEKGLVSIRTACKESAGGNTVVTFNLVPRSSGGAYQFFTAALPASEEAAPPENNTANAAAGRMFDASLKTIGR